MSVEEMDYRTCRDICGRPVEPGKPGRQQEKVIMNKKVLLQEPELFVLDMDGTFYLDDEIIDGSLAFL